jgi:hypothetical protein
MQTAKFEMQTLNGRPLVLCAFCILYVELLLSISGCSAKARAQALPDGPPLAVPVAPVHEIVIEQIAEAPAPEPEPEPVPVQPPPRSTGTRTQVSKPAPRQETTPPPTPPAAVTSQPPPEAPVLRAQPAAAAGDERKVQDLMKKATTDLNRVDYQKLSDDGKAQYDQSKRFNDQAQQAIKERNFVLALTLAEKAATLAAELVR